MIVTPKSFSDVIALWPGGAFAEDVGAPASRVAVWKHRDVIPPEWWDRVAAAATVRKFEDVTLLLLQQFYRAKREGSSLPSGEAA